MELRSIWDQTERAERLKTWEEEMTQNLDEALKKTTVGIKYQKTVINLQRDNMVDKTVAYCQNTPKTVAIELNCRKTVAILSNSQKTVTNHSQTTY